MATKKPAVKKSTSAAEKKSAKPTKKPTAKKLSVKVKPAVKKIATKKIVVKSSIAPAVKKTAKGGLAKPMAKMVVDRIVLPNGGKVFVKKGKRPTAKNTAKKAK